MSAARTVASQQENSPQLAIQPPESTTVPHRFNGRRAFPHAVVASKHRDGREYQLDTSRLTNLTFKFDSLPVDLVAGEMFVGLQLRLEISVAPDSWKTATRSDFPGHKMPDGDFMKIPQMRAGESRELFCNENKVTEKLLNPNDGSITFTDIKLKVLSSETMPQHRLLRFSVEPLEPYNGRKDLTASTIPFVSVAKTISSKKAEDVSANPTGPTQHQIELRKKREASRMAAQEVFDGRFPDIKAALKEFNPATEKLVYKALKTMRNPSGEESSGEREEPSEEESSEESSDEEPVDESIDEAAASEEGPCDGVVDGKLGAETNGAGTSSTSKIVVSTELKDLKAKCLHQLEHDAQRRTSSLHHHRAEHVKSLFTEAASVAEGREDKGVDLCEAERARLAFSDSPITPIDAALEEMVYEFFNTTNATLDMHAVIENHTLQKAVGSLKERIYNKPIKSFWEVRVFVLEKEQRHLHSNQCRSSEWTLSRMGEVFRELKQAKERLASASTTQPGIGDMFKKVAEAMDNLVVLVQSPCEPEGIGDLRKLMPIKNVLSTNEAATIVRAALSRVTESTTVMQSYNSLLRRVERLYKDMEADLRSGSSSRCGVSFLAGALDDHNTRALNDAATHLRQLGKDCKLGHKRPVNAMAFALPLASPPEHMNAPPDGIACESAAIQPTPPRMEWRVLPPIEALEGSPESVLLVPSALLSMPPSCIFQFIAEKVRLPSQPRGSKLLAERALPDVLRSLDTFDKRMSTNEETQSGRNCPFKAYGELSVPTLNEIRKLTREAARLLRGEQPEQDEPASSTSDEAVASEVKSFSHRRPIELDEEKTGLFGDSKSGEFRPTEFRFVFKVPVNGKEHEYPWGVNSNPLHGLGHEATEEDFMRWRSQNVDRAWGKALEYQERLFKKAERAEKASVAKEQQGRWHAVQRSLVMASNPSSGDGPELIALRNAARTLCTVSIESDGQLKGEQWYRATTWLDDNRCSSKCKVANDATRQPIHLRCEDLERGEAVAHNKALDMLKTIAKKAGLDVTSVAYSVTKGETSKAKGKRTTERKQFVGISFVEQLFKLVDVLMEGIKCFEKSTHPAQREWTPPAKKRKRA